MNRKVILSGGGTGGHVFPAISVGLALKKLDPTMEILFVGANGGMEMTLVPKYDFRIQGVTVSGFMRKISLKNILKNLSFPFRLMKGLRQARAIVKEFKPDVVAGFGGFASGPVGRAAIKMNVPLVICEANAYPGVTNKLLASKAARVLLGNEAALKYFETAKCKVTGNPIREELRGGRRESGIRFFGFDENKKTILSLGGSLGAATINRAWEKELDKVSDSNIQLIWQCGKRYFEEINTKVKQTQGVKILPFIDSMADAYAIADVVVSRAGASTLSELIELNKPSILIPSPNVAEDHQTKNAMSIVERGAGILVKDIEAGEKLVREAIALLNDEDRLKKLKAGIEKIEKHNSAIEIAEEIIKLFRN